jgi:putative ABC transport system permease protein
MDRLREDVRYAIRSLIKSPLITVAALISIAFGVGANASIFSAVDVFMIRPLDFDEADNLLAVWTSNPERGWTQSSSSPIDYLDWRERARSVELAAFAETGANLTGGDRPERVSVRQVAANFFDVLRIQPRVGRGFRPEEEQPGAARVLVLGDGLWQRRFGGDPSIVGSALVLNGEPYEVVGIMPSKVGFSSDPDIWVSLRLDPAAARASRYLNVLGRVRPGFDVGAARAELVSIQAQLAAEYPASNAGNSAYVSTLQKAWFDEGFMQGSSISTVAVLFVLLIACSNVANLLLVKGTARAREIALRGALGAGRGRIVRQLMVESLVLALAGGLLGLPISVFGVQAIQGMFPPDMPGVAGVTLNGRVLLFALAVTLGSGLLFGLVPSIRASRLNLRNLLADASRGNTGASGGRLRNALVVGQIGLALVLLISAALLIQGFTGLRRVDMGFRVDDVVTAAVSLQPSAYPEPERVAALEEQLLERVRGLPGVEAAGGTNVLPMHGNTGTYYSLPSEAPPEPGREPSASLRYVTPGYFEALDIAVEAGRPFTAGDRRDAPPVVVINERMAARHWPDGGALGERIQLGGVDHEIVGIVGDTRDFGPDDEGDAMIYRDAFQSEVRTLRLAVRTTSSPEAVTDQLRGVLAELDPDQPVYGVSTLSADLKEELSGSFAMVKVLGALGLIAFLLSAVGVYGVMSYTVAQRTGELGVRMALGAEARDVLLLVLGRGSVITGIGVGIGLLIALGTTRLLAFFLWGVSPFSPGPYAVVTVLVAVTGLVASWVPAMRAARVDPLVVLRSE